MSTSSTTPPAGLPAAYDTLGPYRLAGLLGEGGMGVVYLGLDRAGRAVAIKALRPHIAGDPDARARLAREVATLERVQHPRVAAVLDADPEGERPYIVTRYAPGPPLDDYVTTHGPFRGEALLRLARGLHDALGAIHAAGVVHRDLKPGNVLVVDDDPVVIDFGIAHVADDVRLTSTGLVMGTPGYLSPEVLSGAPVTEATDWWGWASTLAYAATGAPPFGRGRVDVILDRVRSGQHDLTGVDARMRPLLAAALAP
ncbi:serine/threonine-protein kinase, partial [uncultured Arsenicicoccus sp.]